MLASIVLAKCKEARTIEANCKELTSLCEIAGEKANSDFEKGSFFLHSLETLPIQETYYKTLKDSFNVQFLFIDSMGFYNCYDSTMLIRLNDKFGTDIVKSTRSATARLEANENWIRKAEFRGGQSEFLKYIYSGLSQANFKRPIILSNTKVIIQFTIDTSGNIENPIIRRGINAEIDNELIRILNSMPRWMPAYKFGERTKESWALPLQLEFD